MKNRNAYDDVLCSFKSSYANFDIITKFNEAFVKVHGTQKMDTTRSNRCLDTLYRQRALCIKIFILSIETIFRPVKFTWKKLVLEV
jgi:hypothetical protein